MYFLLNGSVFFRNLISTFPNFPTAIPDYKVLDLSTFGSAVFQSARISSLSPFTKQLLANSVFDMSPLITFLASKVLLVPCHLHLSDFSSATCSIRLKCSIKQRLMFSHKTQFSLITSILLSKHLLLRKS